MRKMIMVIWLAGLAAGCATTVEPAGTARKPSLFEAHGREVAQLRCAGCHSVDTYTTSPRSVAPAFRDFSIRFNSLTWERKMAEIAEGGHDEMPPLRLDDVEIRDVRAFIESLR